jgi:hypothetical protein
MNTVQNLFILKSFIDVVSTAIVTQSRMVMSDKVRFSSGIKATVYWDVTPRVFILIQTFRRHLVLSNTGKEATGSTEILVHIYQTIRCQIPEYRNLHKLRIYKEAVLVYSTAYGR